MQAFRAALLRFDVHGAVQYDEDGLLVIGPDAGGLQVVRAAGAYAQLAPQYAGVRTEHLPGRILATCWSALQLEVYYRYLPSYDIKKMEARSVKAGDDLGAVGLGGDDDGVVIQID